MYAFGDREAERRLLPRCVQASINGGRVRVTGGGRSFLNPLPVSFVAEVLLRTADELGDRQDGFFEVTNVNHPETWTVLEVMEALSVISPFDYDVTDGGEDWPVTFHGNVNA